MAANPLVTVLMTVYNGGEYLRTSVPGILNQTFKDFELLIINDCSTDDSVKIIKSFNDKRIIIHNNEKNLGQTKSLNVGLRLARGKYIARMDADDMAFPLWLEKLVYFMEDHPEYVVVGPAATVIDANSKIKNVIFSPDNIDTIIFRIFFETPLNHVGSLMNKEAILKIGGFNESFLVAQDFELWSSIIRNNLKLTSIPDVLVAVRLHEKSLTALASNTRSITEPGQTIYKNVRCLTDFNITYDEALNLRKLFKMPDSLSPDEFCRAVEVFMGIYKNLKYNINKEKIEEYIRSQLVKAYCKRALQQIYTYQITEGRKTSWRYLKEWGFHLMPFAIYLSSFLGERAVYLIFEVYKKILQIRARYML